MAESLDRSMAKIGLFLYSAGDPEKIRTKKRRHIRPGAGSTSYVQCGFHGWTSVLWEGGKPSLFHLDLSGLDIMDSGAFFIKDCVRTAHFLMLSKTQLH